MSVRHIRIVYPEPRMVSENHIRHWYADCIATEKMKNRSGDPDGAEYQNILDAYWNQAYQADLEVAIDYLEEQGLITVCDILEDKQS